MSDVAMWGLGWEAWFLPFIIFGPGFGFARRCRPQGDDSLLGLVIDTAWVGMAITWLNVALVRESGLTADVHGLALVVLAGLWFVVGLWWGRGHGRPRTLALAERLGCAAVFFAVEPPVDGDWLASIVKLDLAVDDKILLFA